MAGEKTKKEQYAIIAVGGQQYQVAVGEEIDVLGLKDKKDGEKVSFNKVLLIKDKEIRIGQPLVEEASVEAEVLNQFRGEKIRVATYRAKSRYRRVKGFRPDFTRLKVIEIKA